MSILFPHNLAANRCCSRCCILPAEAAEYPRRCCHLTARRFVNKASQRPLGPVQSAPLPRAVLAPSNNGVSCSAGRFWMARWLSSTKGAQSEASQPVLLRSLSSSGFHVFSTFLSSLFFFFVRTVRIHHPRCAWGSMWSCPRCLKAQRAHSQSQHA